jgi:hypothetical protein
MLKPGLFLDTMGARIRCMAIDETRGAQLGTRCRSVTAAQLYEFAARSSFEAIEGCICNTASMRSAQRWLQDFGAFEDTRRGQEWMRFTDTELIKARNGGWKRVKM